MVLATLVACGGGGGDSTPTAGGGSAPSTAFKLTSGNYTVAAQEALSTANATQGALVFSEVLTGAAVSGPGLPLAFARAQVPKLQDWLRTVPQQVTGALQQYTEPCAGGGTLGVTVSDINGNRSVDAGDTVNIVATNCNINGNTANGSIGMTVNSTSGNLSGNVYGLNLGMVFGNFSASSTAGTDTLNGSLTLAVQSTGVNRVVTTLSAPNNLTMAGSFGGVAYSRSLMGYSSTVTISPASSGYSESTIYGGTLSSNSFDAKTVVISMDTPFVRTNLQSFPAAGQVVLTGADGSRVRITAQSVTQVQIELDADGNGVYELATTRAWSSLL
ncbi:hypothetical protein [Rhodoferax sp. WC2427]|uniref:hypothetical protein n=1 Tax=Rhodoferax sp. WC2427 TaxID=3234144 RepID=UPI003465BA0B